MLERAGQMEQTWNCLRPELAHCAAQLARDSCHLDIAAVAVVVAAGRAETVASAGKFTRNCLRLVTRAPEWLIQDIVEAGGGAVAGFWPESCRPAPLPDEPAGQPFAYVTAPVTFAGHMRALIYGGLESGDPISGARRDMLHQLAALVAAASMEVLPVATACSPPAGSD